MLEIRASGFGRFDLLSLGECMVRLSPPGHGRIEFANVLEVWVGGGEYNVAYALARLGMRTGFLSRLVDNPIGRIILNHGRAAGVDMSHVVLAPFDGVGREDRVGLNFTEVGTGIRPSLTVYDRGHSAASNLGPGMIDFGSIFAEGARWFHTGGIMTALSDPAAEVVAEAVAAARAAGAVVSYDLNFRSKLWTSARAQRLTPPIVRQVDCLIGNEEDFQKSLGFEVPGVSEDLNALDPAAYKAMVAEVVAAYPNLKVVATTLREVKSGLLNHWSAILWHDGQFFESRRYDHLEIEDRVGGGDGFSAGFIHGLLDGKPPGEAVEQGAALGALLQSTRGDTSQVDRDDLMHVVRGGGARIKR